MTSALIAFLLVTLGAFLHATWNLLVKRSGTTDTLFVWCYGAMAVPVAVVVLCVELATVGPGSWMWAATVSMVLHTLYLIVLQRAYGQADMTLVYPISRGLAPALVALGALPFAGAPSRGQDVGFVLVLVGAWACADGAGAVARGRAGLGLGVLVALCTAAYTSWDAYSVTHLHVPVISYLAMLSTTQFAVLTVALRSRRGEFADIIRTRWRQALPIAVLTPVSYLLVLVAMHFGPPSMVATARCMNVVMGTVLAVLILRERVTTRQSLGIATIVLGTVVSTV